MEFYQKLKNLKKEQSKNIPQEKKDIMDEFLRSLIASHIENKSLKNGDRIPKHELLDIFGNKKNISDYFGEGPVIISFYRGSWCPYCNLELSELAKSLERLKWLKCKLVAVSPELPDKSFSFKQKLGLDFDVLSDPNSEFAKKFHIVFQLNKEMIEVYKEFGINIAESNGTKNSQLPIPASFIFDKKGILRYSFVKADYTERLSPETLIEEVEKIIKEGKND